MGEHYLDAVGVGGSIPPVPTSNDVKGLKRYNRALTEDNNLFVQT